MEQVEQSIQPKTMKVSCRQCRATGMVIVGSPASLAICQVCQGHKEVLVRDVDPCWSINLEGGPGGAKRTLLMVTWGGNVEYAPPLTKDELLYAAKSTDALIAGVIVLASENTRLRKRLVEVERRLNIHVED